ncbi:hypothetical protein SWPG_00197 [Synechococcus phage S-CBM2]|nr:hypothetical protein SWPG_00197 [Synechococcus phage S-CBM2]
MPLVSFIISDEDKILASRTISTDYLPQVVDAFATIISEAGWELPGKLTFVQSDKSQYDEILEYYNNPENVAFERDITF